MTSNFSVAAQVIRTIQSRKELQDSQCPIDETTLTTEYTLAQEIDIQDIECEDIDMVVVLSGRSNFSGKYVEENDKVKICPQQFDNRDTIRRVSYGIQIARKCMQKNIEQGINKPVYLYFNGLEKQNNELREILHQNGSFNGYPASLFIIDKIPLDNTLGQVIGLSYFLSKFWNCFASQFAMKRPPHLIFATSSYHVPRVSLAMGQNSPIHTTNFWKINSELYEKLPEHLKEYVLNQSDELKNAEIMVLGCDRKISALPFWEKDLFCDMEARINYANHRIVNGMELFPSIANNRASNDVTLQKTFMRKEVYQLKLSK